MRRKNRVPNLNPIRKAKPVSEDKKMVTQPMTTAKIAAGWIVDDNADGPALVKVLGRLILSGNVGQGRHVKEVARTWNLMQFGFHFEHHSGAVNLLKLTDAHVRGDIESSTKGGVKIRFIDAIGGAGWRKVGDEYAIFVIACRDGKERQIRVKSGSHAGNDYGVKTLSVTPHGLYFLHPDLLACDVEEEPEVAATEIVEP